MEESESPAFTSQSSASAADPATVFSLAEAGDNKVERIASGIAEVDRVLGGGFVKGSLVLLGGEPGIGKSTLLLQVADRLGVSGQGVLYVCGEESPQQIGVRARRINAASENVRLLPELDIAVVEATVREQRPDVLVLDSIQTACDPDMSGVPGSVGQVRACTARLMRIAKDLGVTTLIVGHVTKEGAIAGPRVLEHMVDTVLYFEGSRNHAFRVVRAAKNRFGATGEIGIFEMGEAGLSAVDSPSAALLAERSECVPGSVVMVAVEGTRPLLVEIQALVTPCVSQMPRRLATGVENARFLQVLAVLESRAGLSFASADVLVSVAGGLKVAESAVDLPLALALASALLGRAVSLDMAAFGEVGLTGHVRPVSLSESRCREAVGLGIRRVIGAGWRKKPVDAAFVEARTVVDALQVAGLLGSGQAGPERAGLLGGTSKEG